MLKFIESMKTKFPIFALIIKFFGSKILRYEILRKKVAILTFFQAPVQFLMIIDNFTIN